MADSYFTKRFRDSRKVYDWLDQFTDQFARMGLIGPGKPERLSFKREILGIIKNEAGPNWNVDQTHDTVAFRKPDWGYGIMACRSTCNKEVKDYWDGATEIDGERVSPEQAASWGWRQTTDDQGVPAGVGINVTDYADIENGTVTDPKEAMRRGAMYYAILRKKSRDRLGSRAGYGDIIKDAFKTYNGRGKKDGDRKQREAWARSEKYKTKADATVSQLASQEGEHWDPGNFSQGAKGFLPAVGRDIASTARGAFGSTADPIQGNASNSALGRGISDFMTGDVPGGRWEFYKKAITDPWKQSLDTVTQALPGGVQTARDLYAKAKKTGKEQFNKYLGNSKYESLEESTEQEILAKFAKEILGLDISDQQMQQVIQRLDITDVVGIKRAIESGDFEGLRLGEGRLKEYHSNPGMADRAKQARAMKEPNTRAAGQPLAPREPKRIAGNNANPERPPTGTSNSTRKPVPSMPKSQIAKNLVVTDPDTGEELNVTNDLAATQMMRRAKRVG